MLSTDNKSFFTKTEQKEPEPGQTETVQFNVYGASKFSNINAVTCYMNSNLHILQMLPIFTNYIVSAEFRDNIMMKISMNPNPDNETLLKEYAVFELFRLFKASLENENIAITPTSFRAVMGKKNDRWVENSQQDAQEFLTSLICQLEEEVGMKSTFIPNITDRILDGNNPVENKSDIFSSLKLISSTKSWERYQAKEYSLLKNLFNGLTINTRQCSCCSIANSVYEPYVTMSLSIPVKKDRGQSFTLYDCIDNFVHTEQLDEENKMNCDMCGIKNRMFSNIRLWRTPKILVIHLKRFLTNQYGIATEKINNNVTYPITDLDLTKYFDDSSPFKNSSKYDLVGVNIHHTFGMQRSINAGHYTAFVKNRTNNHWYHYNDSSPVEHINNAMQLQTERAYMLFYHRHD